MLATYTANPYSDTNLLSFFQILLSRLWLYFTQSDPISLASDELQMLVLTSLAISGALIGPFLVLRKMTMLANALSHTILMGIVVIYLFIPYDEKMLSLPLFFIAAVFASLMTSFLAEFLTSVLNLQPDASVGLTFTSLFALGIVLITLLTRNAHIGTEIVMGNVDALQIEDFFGAGLIAFVNIILTVMFFKEYVITSFDKGLASVLGFSPLFFSYLLMTQTSLTVVSGFRAVGVLMVLALLTAPALTARLFTHHMKSLLLYSCGIGVVTSLLGVALTRHMLSVYGIALSTGGVTVCTLTAIYFLAAGIKLTTFSVFKKVINPS